MSILTAKQEEQKRKSAVYTDNEDELKQALDLSLQEFSERSQNDDSGFDTTDAIPQDEKNKPERKMIKCVPIDILMKEPAPKLNYCVNDDDIQNGVDIIEDIIDSSDVNSSGILSTSMMNDGSDLVISEHSYADMNATPDQGPDKEALRDKPETSTPNSSRKSVIVNLPTSVIKSRNIWSGDENQRENICTAKTINSIVKSVRDEPSTSQNTAILMRASVICSRPGSVSSFNDESAKDPISDNDSGVVVNTLLQEIIDGVFSKQNCLNENDEPSAIAEDVISTLPICVVEHNNLPVETVQNSLEVLTASNSDEEIVDDLIADINTDSEEKVADASGSDKTEVADNPAILHSPVNDDNSRDTEIDAEATSSTERIQVMENPDSLLLPSDRIKVSEIPDTSESNEESNVTAPVDDLPLPSSSSQISHTDNENADNANTDIHPSRDEIQDVAQSSRCKFVYF